MRQYLDLKNQKGLTRTQLWFVRVMTDLSDYVMALLFMVFLVAILVASRLDIGKPSSEWVYFNTFPREVWQGLFLVCLGMLFILPGSAKRYGNFFSASIISLRMAAHITYLQGQPNATLFNLVVYVAAIVFVTGLYLSLGVVTALIRASAAVAAKAGE